MEDVAKEEQEDTDIAGKRGKGVQSGVALKEVLVKSLLVQEILKLVFPSAFTPDVVRELREKAMSEVNKSLGEACSDSESGESPLGYGFYNVHLSFNLFFCFLLVNTSCFVYEKMMMILLKATMRMMLLCLEVSLMIMMKLCLEVSMVMMIYLEKMSLVTKTTDWNF